MVEWKLTPVQSNPPDVTYTEKIPRNKQKKQKKRGN